MKKHKILLIGYSNIAKKRYIKFFLKKKIQFSVASKSYKKKIRNAYQQYSNYDDAITNSGANIAYISLPNSLHFHWAKKALLNGYHVVVDKPISNNLYETNELIIIAKKKNKLISEATFYDYHNQIKQVKNILKKDKLKFIKAQFIIPLPSKKSLLMSKNFMGGVIMDMGPYASSLHRIFFNKKIISAKVVIKNNIKKLPVSFKIDVNYKNQNFSGLFKFGGKYKNEVIFSTKQKTISIQRVFSPPDDLDLNIKMIDKNNNKIENIKVSKDNCFKNFFIELLKKIDQKRNSFYFNRIKQDHLFREKIEKKFLNII